MRKRPYLERNTILHPSDAIMNYEHFLELNPQNNNTRMKLKDLQQ